MKRAPTDNEVKDTASPGSAGTRCNSSNRDYKGDFPRTRPPAEQVPIKIEATFTSSEERVSGLTSSPS